MEKSNSGSSCQSGSRTIKIWFEQRKIFRIQKSNEIAKRSFLTLLFIRQTRRCRYYTRIPEERNLSKSLGGGGGGGRKDGAWRTGWLIQGEPVVETLGEHGMRTRVTISIATHVGVSGAINKARARELRRRDSSLWRGWKSSRPMGLKRTIRSRPGSLLVWLSFRGETMTLVLLLVPCSTTRVVLHLITVMFLFFFGVIDERFICGYE